MPGDDHDDWMESALGVAVGKLRSLGDAVSDDVQSVGEAVMGGAQAVLQQVETAGSAVVNAAKGALGAGAAAGPIGSDCKPVHGFVPGPPEHLLCQIHGHILDVKAGQIIAGSLAEYKQLASSGMLGKAAVAVAGALAPGGAVIGAGMALAELASNDAPGDAGTGEAGVTETNAGDAGAGDAGGGDAGTTELPTFKATTPVPFDVRADTADDFVANANAGMGGVGTVGHMKPSFSWNLETDARGRVTKVNMVVETEIVRPRFAGGRPSDAERAVIKQAEDLIKGHEERHRDIAKDFATRAVKAALGKTASQADATLNQFMKDMDAAQVTMDHREGLIVVEHNGPAGTAGPATGVHLAGAP